MALLASGKFRYTIENESSNAENAHLEIAPRDPRTGRYIPFAGDRDGFIAQSVLTFELNVLRPSRLFGRTE